MDFKPRERISGAMEMTMLYVSGIIWVLSLIPIVNWILNTLGWIIFYLWFKSLGADLFKERGKSIAFWLLGYIPVIGTIFSLFPYRIFSNIRRVNREDAEYNANMNGKMSKKGYSRTMARNAANADENYRNGNIYARPRAFVNALRPQHERESTRTNMPMVQIRRKPVRPSETALEELKRKTKEAQR
jgi:hypothetical protein